MLIDGIRKVFYRKVFLLYGFKQIDVGCSGAQFRLVQDPTLVMLISNNFNYCGIDK